MVKTTVRIESSNRWDALDLTKTLGPWSWYLVSQGVERWEVCVGVDPRRRRMMPELMAAVQAWADRRHVDSVVHLDGGDVAVHPKPEPVRAS